MIEWELRKQMSQCKFRTQGKDLNPLPNQKNASNLAWAQIQIQKQQFFAKKA